ncbi:TolC family protein [Vibrio antiquarius]|uniref:TolC family protein n=1 Tax=Vibrio antiquarius (strain Ex25) TaxID=150340 RepID=UPI0026591545|nr:TolC family protein [Vibrio antiquarius]
MKKFILTPVVLALSLAGCAVGPDYQAPTTSMAETYLNAENAGLSTDSQPVEFWWTKFHDPVLNQMVQDMQSQNIPLKVAAERVKMANNYKTMVESFKVPTINLGAGYMNYQFSKNDSSLAPILNPLSDSVSGLPPQIGNVTLMDNQHDGVFAGASITWEADLFGRIDRQAKATLAAMESLVPQLEIAQQAHKHRLAVLLGEPLTQVEIRLSKQHSVPVMQDMVPVGLPSDLLKRRTDIRLAEREMAALNEELAASVADQYPKFFLTGAPGLSASSFDDLFSSDSFGWMGAAGVSWNLFDGGRGEAIEAINQARFDSATLSYQHTVEAALAETESSLFAYGRSQENQRRIDEALKATNNAVNKAKSLYRAGLIDHLSVLDAQRQQRMMQDQQVAAKLQTAHATIALYKSLGGDWTLQPEAQPQTNAKG